MTESTPTPPPIGYGSNQVISPGTDPANAPSRSGFLAAVPLAFRRYSKFSGRASRSEYWWYLAFFLVCNIPLGLIVNFAPDSAKTFAQVVGTVWGLLALLLFIPWLALLARRIQDTGRSSSRYFRGLIQILVLCPLCFIIFFISVFAGSEVGSHIALALPLSALAGIFVYGLVVTVLPGTPGTNEFGPGLRN